MEAMTREQKKDIRLLGKFVEVYCRGKHSEEHKISMDLPGDLGKRVICSECSLFLKYAISRRLKCPLEADKPTCKHCKIHCYGKEEREQVRQIMSYAGRRIMMQGRLDYLWHYFF